MFDLHTENETPIVRAACSLVLPPRAICRTYREARQPLTL